MCPGAVEPGASVPLMGARADQVAARVLRATNFHAAPGNCVIVNLV